MTKSSPNSEMGEFIRMKVMKYDEGLNFWSDTSFLSNCLDYLSSETLSVNPPQPALPPDPPPGEFSKCFVTAFSRVFI